MITFVVIVLSVAYLFLIALFLRLNLMLYQIDEELAEARHHAARAQLIVGDLVEDERRRQRTEERQIIDFLA